MLRISKLTDYAIQVMVCLYSADQLKSGCLLNTQKLAERIYLEPPTVSKVIKLLCKQGLVESIRGAQGGYRLAHEGATVSVADIIAAIEGPIAMTECSVDENLCGQQSVCGLSTNWRRISDAVSEALSSVSLAEMAGPVDPRQIPDLQIATLTA